MDLFRCYNEKKKMMNFPILWRKRIVECVSTSTVLVLMNGNPTNESKLERGILRCDPLSFFLLIAIEELNVMLKASNEAGLYLGYKVGQEKDCNTSHLQFATIIRDCSFASLRNETIDNGRGYAVYS